MATSSKQRRKKGLSAKKSAQMARLAERRSRVLALRKAGATFREIAATMREEGGVSKGFNEATAYTDYQFEMDRLAQANQEGAEELRRLEEMRLDRMLSALDEGVEGGDPTAINAALRIMERRAKLRGLDAPAKQEIEHMGGVVIHLPSQYETEEAWLKASGEDI